MTPPWTTPVSELPTSRSEYGMRIQHSPGRTSRTVNPSSRACGT
jgi:hypothetical protein